MSAQGIIVVRFTPRRLRSQPGAVIAELVSAYQKGRQRPPLPIRAVPHDASRGSAGAG